MSWRCCAIPKETLKFQKRINFKIMYRMISHPDHSRFEINRIIENFKEDWSKKSQFCDEIGFKTKPPSSE
jgi:hypothetical protein